MISEVHHKAEQKTMREPHLRIWILDLDFMFYLDPLTRHRLLALITIENEADVAAARLAGYEQSLIARLTLKPGKISSLANSIRVLANMEEPIGRVLKKTKIADKFILEKTSSPLGVLLNIF